MKSIIWLVEKNIHGAWVVYGANNVKQYYGCTKLEAIRKYKEEAQKIIFINKT